MNLQLPDTTSSNPHHCRGFCTFLPILSCLILLGFVSNISAQSIPSVGGSGGNNSASLQISVSEEEITSNTLSSYRQAADSILDELLKGDYDKSEIDQENLDQITNTSLKNYRSKVKDKISELRGDGTLTSSEVNSELGILRDQELSQLEELYRAKLKGFPPPPSRENSVSIYDYSTKLIKYAIITRNPFYNWLILLGAIFFSFFLVRFVFHTIISYAEKPKSIWSRRVARFASDIRFPFYLGTIVLAAIIGLDRIWIPIEVRSAISGVAQILMILSVFWALWNISDALVDFISDKDKIKNTEFDDTIMDMGSKLLRLLFIFVFVVFAIEVIFNADLKATIAGIGIVGLAVTFALQGTLKNFISSLTIYTDRPFRMGDQVHYNGQYGPVEKIGFRSTKVRTWDGHLITVPNSELIDKPIENVEARPWIRRRFRIDLVYGTSSDKVKKALEIIDEILENADGRPNDPVHRVEFETFGAYSLKILVQYYYTPPSYWDALKNDTKINLAIMEAFEKEGIEFAFPTISLDEHGKADEEKKENLKIERKPDSETKLKNEGEAEEEN